MLGNNRIVRKSDTMDTGFFHCLQFLPFKVIESCQKYLMTKSGM